MSLFQSKELSKAPETRRSLVLKGQKDLIQIFSLSLSDPVGKGGDASLGGHSAGPSQSKRERSDVLNQTKKPKRKKKKNRESKVEFILPTGLGNSPG